ncbi:conserved hypothetical protein [Gammaproteobacteria bacterium]
MAESVAARGKGLKDNVEKRNVVLLLQAAQADIADLRTKLTTLTAKLDADATVTDTNYGALCNPATQQFTQ